MGISINDLSDSAARRAWEIYLRESGGAKLPDVRDDRRRGKYGAVKEDRGKLNFDSKKEARRDDVLVLLLKSGEITDLKIQPEFTLVEAYTKPDGERVRALRYRADFSYKRDGVLVVEDVKSAATRTRTYLDKRKWMREIHGIEITEIQEVEAW